MGLDPRYRLILTTCGVRLHSGTYTPGSLQIRARTRFDSEQVDLYRWSPSLFRPISGGYPKDEQTV